MFKIEKAKRISVLCVTVIAACTVFLSVVFGVTGCSEPPSSGVFGTAIVTTADSDTQAPDITSNNSINTGKYETTAVAPDTTNTGYATTGNKVETTTKPPKETTGRPQTLPPQTVAITVPVTTPPETKKPPVTVYVPETTRTPETTPPAVTTAPVETTAPAETTPPVVTPGVRPVVTQYPVAYSDRVGDDWFSDAVFVGDSRTQALEYWSDIKTATYYAFQGLNVYTATTNTFISENGKNLTIAQALALHPEFKKIYVCLGVNEYWMAESSYRTYYTNLIDSIMEANPSAAIYIYAVSPVVDGLQNSGSGLNNTKMSRFNQIAKEIAISKGIYYIDADAPFTKVDASGQYRPFLDWTESSDGIHLNGYGLTKLTEYLRTHTK